MTAQDILAALESRSERLCSASELPGLYGYRRVDFWTLDPVGRNETVSYEIKVTRSDFKSDSREKQAFALSISERLFYVTPPGLVSKDEIPEWAGLQEWDGKKFTTRVRAPRRDVDAPSWLLVSSIIRRSTRVSRDMAAINEELNAYRRMAARRKRDAEAARNNKAELDRKLIEHGINPYTLELMTEADKQFFYEPEG